MANLRLKTEIWNLKGKRRKVFVVREKGKLKTWVLVKGLKKKGITKKDILRNVKRTGTAKTTIISREKIGKETIQTISTQRVGTIKNSQLMVTLTITKRGRGSRIFRGFSNKGELDKQKAYNRAIKVAIDSGFITYRDVENMTIRIKEQVSYISYSKVK